MGRPTSASAPAKPNPCIRPNVNDTTQGQRAVSPGRPCRASMISRATKTMLKAMHASTGGCGTCTQPSAAAVKRQAVRGGKRRHRRQDAAPAR